MSAATLPARFRVASVSAETEDTWTLEMEAVGGEALEFAPGQFTMLYAHGVGEVPISISGDPAGAERLVHTVRAVGPVSDAICTTAAGRELGVRGPFGRGWPLAEAEGLDVVVVAGGVGLAPLRSVLYSVLAERERFGRLVLLYGGRRPDQLLYRAEIDRWREHDDVEVELTVDAAGSDWRGGVGVVPALVERAGLEPERSIAMVCGPEVMMRFTIDSLLGAGFAEERVWLSMERNMRCAVGHCGHCQWGPHFVCRDGPVYSWAEAASWFPVREL